MYGPHIGKLNVFAKKNSNFGNPLWSHYGTHGNKWLQGQVSLTLPAPFQIVIEAVRGSDYAGDIAIDDVQLLNGGCPAPKVRMESFFKMTSSFSI